MSETDRVRAVLDEALDPAFGEDVRRRAAVLGRAFGENGAAVAARHIMEIVGCVRTDRPFNEAFRRS